MLHTINPPRQHCELLVGNPAGCTACAGRFGASAFVITFFSTFVKADTAAGATTGAGTFSIQFIILFAESSLQR